MQVHTFDIRHKSDATLPCCRIVSVWFTTSGSVYLKSKYRAHTYKHSMGVKSVWNCFLRRGRGPFVQNRSWNGPKRNRSGTNIKEKNTTRNNEKKSKIKEPEFFKNYHLYQLAVATSWHFGDFITKESIIKCFIVFFSLLANLFQLKEVENFFCSLSHTHIFYICFVDVYQSCNAPDWNYNAVPIR